MNLVRRWARRIVRARTSRARIDRRRIGVSSDRPGGPIRAMPFELEPLEHDLTMISASPGSSGHPGDRRRR